MKLLKLTTLALASSLLLAGCGGGDSTDTSKNNGGNHSGETQTKLSELDQAKEIIRTAKLFVSDKQAIQDAYEGAGSVISSKQSKRLSTNFQLVESLKRYMKDHNLNKIDAAKLKSLTKAEDFQDYFYDMELQPSQNFEAKLDNNYKFSVSGDITVDTQDITYHFNPNTYTNEKVVKSSDSFMVSYNGFEDATQNNTSTKTPKLNFGFNSITIGSGSEKVMLTSSKQGIKAVGTFSDKVTLNDDFRWEKTHKKGITLQKAEVTLDNVKLVANDSTVTAKDFLVAIMDVNRTLADGSKDIRSLPYKIELTGHLNKGVPKTDVEMSFNAIANVDDVKKFIEFKSENKIVEKEGHFVGMTAMLSLKGEVTKKLTDDKAVVIPLDFLAKLKRTSRDEVILEDLTKFSVENKPLHIKGNYKLNSNEDTVAQFVVTQNNARIELNVDAEGEFKTNDQGKLSDIMVNGKDFGDLIDDNKGTVKAVFHDSENTVIFL